MKHNIKLCSGGIFVPCEDPGGAGTGGASQVKSEQAPAISLKVARPPPAKRLRAGGSPYTVYQNMRLEAAKRMAPASDLSARGTLTEAARLAVVRDCQATWAGMSDDQKEMYLNIYRDRRREKE